MAPRLDGMAVKLIPRLLTYKPPPVSNAIPDAYRQICQQPYTKSHLFAQHRRSSTTTSPAPEPSIITQIDSVPSHPSSTVATITINHPSKLNSLNSALLTSLNTSFNSLSSNPPPDLRAVVLTGARPSTPRPNPTSSTTTTKPKTPAFISGASIPEMSQVTSPTQAHTFIQQIHTLCTTIRHHPLPILASIHGLCLGAGLEIAASCDLRLATRHSTFGMPEVSLGIPSVVEARLLPDLIGWGRARELMLLGSGRIIDSVEARDWALINYLADTPEELDRRIMQWVGSVAAAGPRAMRAQKKLMREWEEVTVAQGIELGVAAFAEVWEGQDGGKEVRELMGRFTRRKRG